MATYGKKLLDATGNVILPKTRSNLVYHGSTLLSTKLNSIDKEISNIKNGTTKVAKATTADNANAVAWNNVSGKPSSFTPSSHKSGGKYNLNRTISRNSICSGRKYIVIVYYELCRLECWRYNHVCCARSSIYSTVN